MSVRIIPREEWGAQHGTGWGERPLPATEAWLHHTVTAPPGPSATFAQDAAHARLVEQIGKDRFGQADYVDGVDQWPGEAGAGISYTTLTTPSCRTFRGHDPKRQSSHTSGHNYAGVGLAVAGDYTDTDPDYALLEEIAGTLRTLAAEGTLATPRLNGDHKSTGYPTTCAGRLGSHVGTINALAGGAMARRRPTNADLRNKEAELRNRGFEIYCGPSYYAAGHCRPGKHAHSADSRHFIAPGMALDVGKDPRSGAAVSDYERAHLDLLCLEFANDPYIEWRIRWRDSSAQGGGHHDHLHVDDRPDWFQTRNLSGTLARDGVDIFIDVKSFPRHVPPINAGFSLDYIAREIQPRLRRVGLYRGSDDGYRGKGTKDAIVVFQKSRGLVADGEPGQKTLAALKVAVAELDAPKPAPAPVPTPAPEPAPAPAPEQTTPVPGRLAGADRFETAALVAMQAGKHPGALKVYLAADGTDDVAAAASAGDGIVLLARRGAATLPGATAEALSDLRPEVLVIVGGVGSVPESQARTAHAIAIK